MVTQYVGSNGITSTTAGWKKVGCTLTATSEGGKIRGAAGSSRQIWYELAAAAANKSRSSDPNLVAGKQYTLQGARIRRDTAASGDVQVSLLDVQRSNSVPAVSLIIPASSMPVGQWVNVPNLVTPLVWNGPLPLDVQIAPMLSTDDFDFTVTHLQVYQAAQAPAGPTIVAAAFTYTTSYLSATFTEPNVYSGAIPTAFTWDFGDGTIVTARKPTHQFTAGGTYNVKLTLSNGVNPNKTKTIAVTVAAPPIAPTAPIPPPVEPVPPPAPTLNPYSDMLSLQIHTDPPEGIPVNLVPNPNGELGSWGWVTPVAGSVLRGINEPNGYTGWQPGLLYEAQTGVANYFYTEPMPVDEGVFASAKWRALYVGNYYKVLIEYLDASFAVIGSDTSGYLTLLGSFGLTGGATPVGTAYARIRFEAYANNTGSIYLAAGWRMAIREVALFTGPDRTALLSKTYQPDSAQWTDILGPTHQMKISRHELDVGTLSAVVLDAALDPVNAPDMRPGNRVRVQAPNADTGAWENLFEGRIDNAVVTYVPRVRIELTATDNVTALANTPRAEGVEHIAELPYLLEGGGVPWMVNDSGDQVPTAAVVSVNDNAKLLDQLAITRDTALGYAWVDRYNVVRAYDAVAMPTTPVGLLDEDDYSDLDIGFDTHQLINVVTVKWLRYDAVTGETTEIVYGPYTDPDSVEDWGYLSAEFTIHGAVENAATIAAFANVILAANAVPVRRVNSMRIPIRGVPDVVKGKGLLDLYDLVSTSHTDSDTTRDLRVTGIEHEIAADPRRRLRWMMNLSFTVDESVATPQSTPSPPPPAPAPPPIPGETVTDSGDIAATSPFTGSIRFVKVGNRVFATGNIQRATGSDSAFTNTVPIPAGMRPPIDSSLYAQVAYNTNPPIYYRFRVTALGQVQIQQTGVITTNMTLDAFWMT